MFLFKKEETPVEELLEVGQSVKFKTEDPDFKKYNNKKATVLYVLPDDDTNCECYCYRIEFNSGAQIDAFDYELTYA